MRSQEPPPLILVEWRGLSRSGGGYGELVARTISAMANNVGHVDCDDKLLHGREVVHLNREPQPANRELPQQDMACGAGEA